MKKDWFELDCIQVAGAMSDALSQLGLIDQTECVKISSSADFGRRIIEEAKKALQSDSSLMPSDPDKYLEGKV